MLVSEDQLYCKALTVCVFFPRRLDEIFAGTILCLEDSRSKEEYALSVQGAIHSHLVYEYIIEL